MLLDAEPHIGDSGARPCSKLQSEIASLIVRCCICSESAAKSLRLVELPAQQGRIGAPVVGALRENRSAHQHLSVVQLGGPFGTRYWTDYAMPIRQF
jgi:hypothetical protein